MKVCIIFIFSSFLQLSNLFGQTKNNLSNQESLIPVKKNLMLSQIDDITGLKPVDKTGTVSASDKIIIIDKSKTPQNFTNKKRNKIKFYNKRIKSKQ